MIKLSLPPFDPSDGLVFVVTYYSYYYNQTLDRTLRGLYEDEQQGDRLESVPFSFGVPDATNELATVRSTSPRPGHADGTPPAGPYTSRFALDTWRNGVDGTAGWFTITGGGVEIVDIKVTYTPAGGESDRVAQGYFV